MMEHRYVVVYWDKRRKCVRRSRTLARPSGVYGSQVKAENTARLLRAKGLTGVRVIELKLPAKVSNWKKWTPQRAATRVRARAKGFILTSGDRSYNSLASVYRTSDHWDEVHASWADDYWHPDVAAMHAWADKLIASGRYKQVLVHDAGTGIHLHVAGRT